MKILLAALFYFFVFFIGIMPFRLIYLFSDGMKLILGNLMKYRKKVILANFDRAFPKTGPERKKQLLNAFYRNLTDVLTEGIKSFSMSRHQVNRRHVLLNGELLDKYRQNGKSFIILAGHYANWEWGSLSASLQTGFNVIGFYKPLSNRYVDRLLKKSRSRFGTTLTSIYETSLTFEKYAAKNTMFLMAADQSPSRRQQDKAIWVDFLGIKTAFLHGPEKHARNNNLDVLYVDIQRLRRGYYTMKLELIAAEPATLPPGELTKRYAARLEEIIRQKPADWLWSHKRWKLNR